MWMKLGFKNGSFVIECVKNGQDSSTCLLFNNDIVDENTTLTAS